MAPPAFDSSPTSFLPQSSFTPPTSTPSTGLSPSPKQFTPSPTTRQRRTMLVTMGPCNWQSKYGLRCLCTFGFYISDLDASLASCDNCGHSMSMHSDYATPDPPTSSHAPSRRITPYELPPFVNPRTKLVDEIIARVQRRHIIRVRGTPASGKTTIMQLVANKLLGMYGLTTPIHTLSGWNENVVNKATGWNAYLKQETGVDGEKWPTYSAYLLLDEAQQSYWDDRLWADLFKAIQPATCSPFIILFSSYGSPNRGYEGFGGEEHIKTPMVFHVEQQISMRPDESIDSHLPISRQSSRPVGLLLDEDEAIDIVTRYASSAMQPSPSLSANLKKGISLISEGHAGLLTSLVHALQFVPELYALIRIDIPLDWQTASKYLFSQPLNLFNTIRGSSFTRGLPPPKILRHSATARIFKKAIAYDEIFESSFENEELKMALRSILRNGWLHAETSNDDVRYVFPTHIHRWYCHRLFREMEPDGEINYDTPLRLAVDAIMQFRPRQLSDPLRSLAGNTLLLEDQYQKEFYRCLFTILDGHVEISPEFVAKAGTNGGTIDFLVARKKWGFELLRDRDRLVEHMKRFEPDGQYFGMIQSGDMEQYIVLDFTVTQPMKARPEYQGHLYHVVFSQNYREVEVIDASDLSVVESLALTENANPIA